MNEESNSPIEDVVEQLRSGIITVQEANQLWDIAIDKLARISSPDRIALLERWGMEEEDLIFQTAPDRMPQLHPMLQGMIGELLQFDGDVPELRTGRLPDSGTPAVPVQTVARNPVLIGMMLKQASTEVLTELRLDESRQTAALEEVFQNNPPAVQEVMFNMVASTPGYEPGRSPVPRVMEEPPSQELLLLTKSEKQDLWHKTITSTQGRKSAVPVITQLVLENLRKGGLRVQEGGPPDLQRIFAAEWVMEIYGTQNEANPNFSYIDIAALSIARKLQDLIRGSSNFSNDMILHVRPINTVEARIVGWQGVLYERQGAT